MYIYICISINRYKQTSIAWHRLIISGHSQGGGHAAWAAARLALGKAILISAPHDECVGEERWTMRSLRTEVVAGLAHIDEVPIFAIFEFLKMLENRRRFFLSFLFF